MNITWQDAVAAGIILIAFGYVARGIVRTIRRKGLVGCSACSKCSVELPEPPLVGLDEQPPNTNENLK